MNTTTQTEQKILTKIEKLLAMAGSSNPHEAELALQKALELSMLHNIDMSRVGVNNTSSVQATHEKVSAGVSRLSVTHNYTASIIKKFFNAHIVTSGGRADGRNIYFFGRQDDIDQAKFLYNFLNETFMRLWHAHYKANPWLNVKTSRKSYFLGLYHGLCDKLTITSQSVQSNLNDDEKSSYQLMVVDIKTQIEQVIDDVFSGRVKTVKRKTVYADVQAIEQGRKDGYAINIHSGLTNKSQPMISA